MTDAEAPEPPPPAPEEAVPKEPPMEIHKPKPVHNWRELLTELGIVVLGICIAISLEQSVEHLHWRGEVRIGRQALVEEITGVDTFYARRVLIAPCLDRRLDEDAGRIRELAANRKIAPRAILPGETSPGALLGDAEWQSERSSQTLTHFPRAELALMSRFYAQMTDMREWLFEEERSLSALAVMADDPDHLGPADLAQLRVNLNTARMLNYLITRNARRELGISSQLGIRYPRSRGDFLVPITIWCKPGETLGTLPD